MAARDAMIAREALVKILRAEGKNDKQIVEELRKRGITSTIILPDKSAKAKRYERFVKGRVEMLKLGSITKGFDERTLRKLAKDELKPYFKEYAKVRRSSHAVWHSKKLSEKERRTQGLALKKQQIEIRNTLAKLTGQTYYIIPSSEERLVGES